MKTDIIHIDYKTVRKILDELGNPKNFSYPSEIDLSTASRMDDDAAELLREYKRGIHGMVAINLNGLIELTESAAKSLAKFQGRIYLNGLTSISIKVANALAKHSKNQPLHLDGITELPEATQIALGKHSGSLSLNGLTDISDEAAEVLSMHQFWGDLYLNGLTRLSDGAARAFAKRYRYPYTCELHLNGLTELTDTAAEELSQGDGYIVFLNGLTSLSPQAAASFAKSKTSFRRISSGPWGYEELVQRKPSPDTKGISG
jgi:hypothetical protein